MKKQHFKSLKLNKSNISNLKNNSVIGGVTGQGCEFTFRFYKTCYTGCGLNSKPSPDDQTTCFNC